METAEFFDLVEDFFGDRATMKGFNRSHAEFTATLYETFRVTCGLGGDHGEFGASVDAAAGAALSTFFGRNLSLNSDRESILESLRILDDWCRLHLTDAFLKRYEAGLGGERV